MLSTQKAGFHVVPALGAAEGGDIKTAPGLPMLLKVNYAGSLISYRYSGA